MMKEIIGKKKGRELFSREGSGQNDDSLSHSKSTREAKKNIA